MYCPTTEALYIFFKLLIHLFSIYSLPKISVSNFTVGNLYLTCSFGFMILLPLFFQLVFHMRVYQDSTQFYCLLPKLRLIWLDFVIIFFFNSSLQHNHLLVIHQICQSILQVKRLMSSCGMTNLEGTCYNLIALRINITLTFS